MPESCPPFSLAGRARKTQGIFLPLDRLLPQKRFAAKARKDGCSEVDSPFSSPHRHRPAPVGCPPHGGAPPPSPRVGLEKQRRLPLQMGVCPPAQVAAGGKGDRPPPPSPDHSGRGGWHRQGAPPRDRAIPAGPADRPRPAKKAPRGTDWVPRGANAGRTGAISCGPAAWRGSP